MPPVLFERLPKGGHQLSIDGKPFLCRAGELQNSTLSCPAYMRDVWPRLVEGNINTVLGAVCWEDVEPVEGQFKFDDLSEVIDQAREHGVKLVLLWFGSHKNGPFPIRNELG
jgi:beta-galactosidase GanA